MEENENGRVASPDHLQDFQLFFFFVQHKFYFTFSGLWSPPKESPLSMEKFLQGGGGGGGGGGEEGERELIIIVNRWFPLRSEKNWKWQSRFRWKYFSPPSVFSPKL